MPPFDLSSILWFFLQPSLSDMILKTLGQEEWRLLKENRKRQVYAAESYIIKIYKYKGPLVQLKKWMADGARKEWEISTRLFSRAVVVPEPIAFGRGSDVSFFISRSVEPCYTAKRYLAENWHELDRRSKYRLADRFAEFMIHLYQAGLLQEDYNLGNILVSKRRQDFFPIDFQRACIVNRALASHEIAENLAFLLPCFHHVEQRYQLRFLIRFIKEYPEIIYHIEDIQKNAFKRLRRHWLKKSKRILRKDSPKHRHFNKMKFDGYLMPEISADLSSVLLKDPQGLFEKSIVDIKNSKRSRVSLIAFGERRYILKRYNLKSRMQRLGRMCRPSLAWRIWENTHLFAVRGLSTPRLVASINLGSRKTYRGTIALYEYIEKGAEIKDLFKLNSSMRSSKACVTNRLARILWELHRRGIYHGDAKISNFIWVDREMPNGLEVIDLDRVRFLREVSSRQRLSDLKNMASSLAWWEASPNVREDLFIAYIKFHAKWQEKRDYWLRRFRRKAEKQLHHRLQRQGKPINHRVT